VNLFAEAARNHPDADVNGIPTDAGAIGSLKLNSTCARCEHHGIHKPTRDGRIVLQASDGWMLLHNKRHPMSKDPLGVAIHD